MKFEFTRNGGAGNLLTVSLLDDNGQPAGPFVRVMTKTILEGTELADAVADLTGVLMRGLADHTIPGPGEPRRDTGIDLGYRERRQ